MPSTLSKMKRQQYRGLVWWWSFSTVFQKLSEKLVDIVCHPSEVAVHIAWLHTRRVMTDRMTEEEAAEAEAERRRCWVTLTPADRGRAHEWLPPSTAISVILRANEAEPASGAEPTWKEFFLRRLMELTPPHLRAIYARALYNKRHSASANPACHPNRPRLNLFPRVPVYHVGVIEKNVAKKGRGGMAPMWQTRVIASPDPK